MKLTPEIKSSSSFVETKDWDSVRDEYGKDITDVLRLISDHPERHHGTVQSAEGSAVSQAMATAVRERLRLKRSTIDFGGEISG